MTASLTCIARDLDSLQARFGLELGERLLTAVAELPASDFRRLLKRFRITGAQAAGCMRLARDPDGRTFIEHGMHKAVILTALPRDARAAFLESHDVASLAPAELAEAVSLVATGFPESQGFR